MPSSLGSVQVGNLREHWCEFLRLIASLEAGTVLPSVMLKKLAAYRRQNRLDLALQELSCIERTLFVLDWLNWTSPQFDALHAATCTVLIEEHASGASRAHPQPQAALSCVRRGDTLVVARIDRIASARPFSHSLRRIAQD